MPAAASRRPLRLAPSSFGVHAAESIHAPGFVMADEAHVFHELFYLLRGDLKVFVEDAATPLFLAEGALLPMPGGQLHRMVDTQGAVLLILALTREFVAGNATREELWKTIQWRGAEGIRPGLVERERIERAFRAIFAEQSARRTGHDLVIAGEVDAILVSLARLPDDQRERNSHVRVADVLRSLEETFFEDWDIEVAARRAHLSRRRFSTLFHELTGMSFIDKRNELRLAYAAERIASGTATILSASFSSGFGDLAHFYRLFRRRYGCSPGEWARDQGAASRRRSRP